VKHCCEKHFSLPAFYKNKIYRRQQPNCQHQGDKFLKTDQQQQGRKYYQENRNDCRDFFYKCFKQY